MALKTSQYNQIMRDYDRKRDLVHADLQKREEEIDEIIPEYRELTGRLAGVSSASVRRALVRPDEAAGLLEEVRRAGEEIARRKQALLLSHGYPADYLEPRWFCPDCQDTGRIGDEFCHCFRKASVELLYAQSNLADILEKENFDHFDESYYNDTVVEESTGVTPRQNIREIRGIFEDFIRDYPEGDRQFFLYGNTGLGKTFLCHCVAKEFLDRSRGVLFYTLPALINLFEVARFERGGEDPAALRGRIESLYECDLLILDDLGTETVNSFTASELLELMDRRQAAGLATILSSNLSPAEIRRVYSERIYSRLLRDYTMLKFTGLDIRTQIAGR